MSAKLPKIVEDPVGETKKAGETIVDETKKGLEELAEPTSKYINKDSIQILVGGLASPFAQLGYAFGYNKLVNTFPIIDKYPIVTIPTRILLPVGIGFAWHKLGLPYGVLVSALTGGLTVAQIINLVIELVKNKFSLKGIKESATKGVDPEGLELSPENWGTF